MHGQNHIKFAHGIFSLKPEPTTGSAISQFQK